MTHKPEQRKPEVNVCTAIVIPTAVPITLNAATNFRLEEDRAHCVHSEAWFVTSKTIELKFGTQRGQTMVVVWKQLVAYMEERKESKRMSTNGQ